MVRHGNRVRSQFENYSPPVVRSRFCSYLPVIVQASTFGPPAKAPFARCETDVFQTAAPAKRERVMSHWVLLDWTDGTPKEVVTGVTWSEAASRLDQEVGESPGRRFSIDPVEQWFRYRERDR